MTPFDGNDYRKRVMARLLVDNAAADPETGDPFLVCDVAPDAADADIRRRLDDVVAFWQKERNHPRYKGIAAQLVSRKDAYAAVLLDPDTRSRALERVSGVRAGAERDALEGLDRLAATLVARYGGVPRTRVARLEQAAQRRGIGRPAFARWLSGQQLVDVEDETVQAWDAGVRRQIRTALDELAALSGDRERYRTLWTFLQLPAGASTVEVTARYDEALGRNQAGRHDRARTLTGDLLGHVKTRLMQDGAGPAYAASIRADARDAVSSEIEEQGLLAGSLGAAEVAALSARIVGWRWGIDAAEARDLVSAAAGAQGIAVEVGGAVDLVVCARCHNPQQAAADGICRYCGAQLFLDCPHCHARIEAAAQVCPRCHTDLAAFRAERDRRTWAEVTTAVGEHRYWAATGLLEGLDGVGPDGRSAEQWNAQLAPRRAELSAQALAAAGSEAELTALLALAPDCPEALAALARLPLPPVQGFRARAGRDAVDLSWYEPDGESGSFRIVRFANSHDTVLGRTESFGLTDAGAPAGVPVQYEIVHTVGGRHSSPLRSNEIVLLRDVSDGEAEVAAGRITVTWRAPDAGSVLIERSVDDNSVRAPTRRIRPDDVGRYVDPDPQTGVRYRYRVFVEYDLPDGVRATPGLSATARIVAPPTPVEELWLDAADDGAMVVGYPRPRSGSVVLVAGLQPFGEPGEQLSTAELEQRLTGFRVLSRGERKGRDTAARGRVVYTAISVEDPLAVVGASTAHLAAPPVTGLVVATRRADAVVLDWTWPAGVTEAAVLWRTDRRPTGPQDPQATGRRVTNTRMQLDGGCPIALNARFVAVYPLLRPSSSAPPVPVASAARFLDLT